MDILITRDSVAAGDDIEAPHERTLSFPDGMSLEEIIGKVSSSGYLASITGGKATWSVVSRAPLAVVAQQWSKPRLLVWRPQSISALRSKHGIPHLHFNYHAQQDPEVVCEVLMRLGPSAF